jgi:hypothetical protein
MVHHSEASALAVVQRAPVNVQGSIIVSNAAALDNAAAARSSAYLLQTLKFTAVNLNLLGIALTLKVKLLKKI